MRKYTLLFLLMPALSFAQSDTLFIRKIYDEALVNGHSYRNLRSLCKDIGARLTGSAEAEMAIRWGEALLRSYSLDNVQLQEFKAPHWERGNTESGWISTEKGRLHQLRLLALGGSVGTEGLLEGDVIEVMGIDEMQALPPGTVKGKVVFFNRGFDQSYIRTFGAYGACGDQRRSGALEAGKLGAKAVIIRSLAQNHDHFPHTGGMHYEDGQPRIPAAALSTNDADTLALWLQSTKVKLSMELDCRELPDVMTHNVMAEIVGQDPKSVITFGGHLDSWDVGEGAHDDGAGIAHSIEAIRLLKALGYKPRYTLRCVLFMNEENGNNGGQSYAKWTKARGERQVAAIESDRCGFLPEGFDVEGTDEQVKWVKDLAKVLYDFRLSRFEKGGSGVDISPLKDEFPGILMLGMDINSQEYFDHHHTHHDVFEQVNKRELELGSAAMASMIYLIDRYLGEGAAD